MTEDVDIASEVIEEEGEDLDTAKIAIKNPFKKQSTAQFNRHNTELDSRNLLKHSSNTISGGQTRATNPCTSNTGGQGVGTTGHVTGDTWALTAVDRTNTILMSSMGDKQSLQETVYRGTVGSQAMLLSGGVSSHF